MAITPRLLFLKKKWDERLVERQAKDSSHPQDVNPMDFLIDIDPTKKREYTDWLCRTYVSGNFRYEDRDRVKVTLELFNRYKHRLPVEQRDIGRMKTEQDVWAIVEGFLPKEDNEDSTPGGREKKRHERAKAMAESDLVDSELSDGWIIASPNTHFASRWWGRGTRWCTAMKTPEHYDAYMETSPLRIFITPEGKKLQAHISSMTICDDRDVALNFSIMAKTLPEAGLELLRRDLVTCFEKADINLLENPSDTPDEILNEVTKNALRQKLKTIADVEMASSKDGWSLRMLETKYSKWFRHLNEGADIPLQKGTVRQDGNIIYLTKNDKVTNVFPFHSRERDKARTAKLLDAIVATNDREFIEACAENLMEAWLDKMVASNIVNQFMDKFPDDCKNDNFWQAYTKGFAAYTRSAEFVSPPEKYLTGEVTKQVATYNLPRIPLHLMSREIVENGLSGSGSEGKRFAKENDLFRFMTEKEILNFATLTKGDDVEYLPNKYITPFFAERFVEQRPAHIGLLDLATEYKSTGVSVITEDLCLKAIELSQAAISSIPRRMLTPEMCHHAIQHHRFAINEIPEVMRTPEMYMESIAKEPDTISYVHSDAILIPYDTFLAAVTKSSSHLGIVPLPYRTVDMCQAALSELNVINTDVSHPEAIENVRTQKIEAIAKHIPPNVARQIPEVKAIMDARHWQGDFLARSYSNDPYIREFVPSDDIPDALPRLFKGTAKKEFSSMPDNVIEIMEEFEAMRLSSSQMHP